MIIEATENFGAGTSTMKDYEDSLFAKLNLIAHFSEIKAINPNVKLEKIRKPIFVSGKPGISKTARTMSVVDKINSTIDKDEDKFAIMKIQLGQTVVGELSQIPMVLNDEVVPYESPLLPVMDKYEYIKDEAGKKIKNPKYHKRGVLFLDEMTSTSTEQVQPALGLADESRTINGYTLPKEWVVVGAGNGPDCANFVRMDSMTVERFEMFDILDIDFKRDFRDYFTKSLNMDPSIVAFLDTHPEFIVDTNEDTMGISGKQGPSARTWEMLSDAMTNYKLDAHLKGSSEEITPERIQKMAERCVGETAATELYGFIKINDEADIKPQDILQGKAKGKASIKIEVVNYLIESCTKIMRNEYQTKGNMIDKDLMVEIANYLKFFIETKSPEFGCISMLHLIMDIDETRILIADPNSELSQMIPDLNAWFDSMTSTLTDSDLDLFNEMCNN